MEQEQGSDWEVRWLTEGVTYYSVGSLSVYKYIYEADQSAHKLDYIKKLDLKMKRLHESESGKYYRGQEVFK